MYCLKCGQQLPDNARFCPSCGTDQYAAWDRAPAPARLAAPPPTRQAAPPPPAKPHGAPKAQAPRPAGRSGGSKKKRYIAAALLVLFAAGVVWNRLRSKIDLPKSKAYAPIVSQYSYNALPDDASRELYKEIEKGAYSYPQEYDGRYFFHNIPIKDGVTTTQFYLAFRAFTDDHPDVFWLYWGTRQIERNEADPSAPDHFVVCSHYSYDELKAVKAALYEAMDRFLASVPAGLSTRELQTYAHDYLIDHCTYDEAALDANGDLDPGYPNIYRVTTALGALADGRAVCSGYAAAYQLMLNRLGVECVPITGQGHPVDAALQRRTGRNDHRWNAVRDGGAWVMTDVTWDDAEDPAERHRYFNLPIAQMYADHNAQAIDLANFTYSGPFITLNTQTDCLFLPR